MDPKIQLVYFSPTGTTKRHLDAIIQGFGGIVAPDINLTDIKNRGNVDPPLRGDIIFIGVPVYSGSIPHLILPSLEKLDGTTKWAILVSTYGNVTAGTCLQDLARILTSRGFRILGTASCIGEHSFCCDQVPLAPGRPDGGDLDKDEAFGRQLRQKYQSDPFPLSFPKTDAPPEKPRTSAVHLPEVNMTVCTKCLKCIPACPTDAIDPETLAITDERCILCCACVKVCDAQARKKQFNLPPDKFNAFYEKSRRRLEPEFTL